VAASIWQGLFIPLNQQNLVKRNSFAAVRIWHRSWCDPIADGFVFLVFIVNLVLSKNFCLNIQLIVGIVFVYLYVYIFVLKVEGKGLDTCYSATYMSQTRDQQRFTISEVAADWHEPMVPQRIMWPSIARANGQLDPRCS